MRVPTFTPFRCVIFLLALACHACGGSSSEVKTIKVGLTHGKHHSFTQALEKFAEEFEEETEGRFRVKIFHSSQLGGEKEMQEMLAIGSLDMCLTGILNTYAPLFALLEMPYLYRDRRHVVQVNESAILEGVASSLEPKGLKLLGFYENGFRHISNSVRPIESPQDLAGLLIRTPENPAQIETIRALGGVPTPMSFSELYTALLQGVVDGQENPLQNIWHGRLYEAQKYIAKTAHIYNSVYLAASMRFWNTLTTGEQDKLKVAIRQSSSWQLAYMEDLDKKLEEDMRALGVVFTYPDQKVFEAACEPAYDALFSQFGPTARNIVKQIKEMK